MKKSRKKNEGAMAFVTNTALWEIGLSSWIVQDGNYPNFAVGKEYAFALEFDAHSATPSSDQAPWMRRIGLGHYSWNAKVLVAQERLTVLEAEIRFYRELKPNFPVKLQDFLRAEGRLGVDPFFWMDNHAHKKDLPSLIYRWRLRGILLETTPWQKTIDSSGRTTLVRGNEKRSHRAIEKTDTWSDDDGRAEYILQCELLGLV